MVPASWVVLPTLPLNANGKIDRKALPEPQGRAAGQEHVEPESDTQRLLAGLWRELLHTERVGLHDNFFALGGHSLMATQLVSRLRQARGIELPLRAVFEAPVLAQLAARVDAEQATAARDDAIAAHGAAPGEHPLSFAQERLFFLDQLEPGSAAYNIPMALRLRGALDTPALERALDTVVRRHAALRTCFAHDAAGHAVAVVHSEPLAPLQIANLSAFADAEGAMRMQATEASSAPFDLQRGPLLRTRLLRLRADEHVLLLTLHHVVADAWSIGVLVREVLALYAAFSAGAGLAIERSADPVHRLRPLATRVVERRAPAGTDGVLDCHAGRRPGPRSSCPPTGPARRCRPSLAPRSNAASVAHSRPRSTPSARRTAPRPS